MRKIYKHHLFKVSMRLFPLEMYGAKAVKTGVFVAFCFSFERLTEITHGSNISQSYAQG